MYIIKTKLDFDKELNKVFTDDLTELLIIMEPKTLGKGTHLVRTITSFVNNYKQTLESNDEIPYIRICDCAPFLFDPTKHVEFVPVIKLTQDERKTLLSENLISADNLCSLYSEDPVSILYNFREGDIVKAFVAGTVIYLKVINRNPFLL
jgi:DNA-directed RNA polymerase subunit H (RpoH/RPB5)